MNKQLIKEWENEPNFLEFIDDSTGYKCFILRRKDWGSLQGFVQIPKEHSHRLSIKKLKIRAHDWIVPDAGRYFRYEFKPNLPIDDFTRESYLVFFSCSDIDDLLPYSDKNNPNAKYRNIEYVTNECKKLAKQLKMYE
jgi:hypothetical protein